MIVQKIKALFLFIRKKFKKDKLESFIKEQRELDKKLVFSLSKSRIPSFKQLKHLPEIINSREKKIILACGLLVIVALIILGINLYLEKITYLPIPGGKYTEGLVGAPQYINPILAQNNDVDSDLSRIIFSGLIKLDERQNIAPDIATRYEVSTDQKTYIFYLRNNVLWHDGEKFTADDVIFTINSIQNQDYGSPLRASFNGIKAEKTDDYAVKFTLAQPFAPFLSSLTFGILPQHIWQDIPISNIMLAEYNLKPIGTGPFLFSSLTKDTAGDIKSYTLTRNEKYYGQKSYLDKITFKFYDNFQTAVDAMESKSTQGISLLPRQLKSQIIDKSRFNYYPLGLPQYTAIFINQGKNVILKDKDVRKALALGINRDKIVNETLGGDAGIVNGPILPGFLGFNPDLEKINYDPSQAMDILEKDGYRVQPDNSRLKDKTKLEITLTTVDQDDLSQVAKEIQTEWQAIGVAVNLQIVPGEKIKNDVIKPREYQMLLYGEMLGSDPDPYPFWHSSQTQDPGLNLSLFSNREADQLMETARQTTNLQDRYLKYIRFQNILAAELPAIFLYSPNYTYTVSKDIKGISLERIAVPSDRFFGVEGWYTKTKRNCCK